MNKTKKGFVQRSPLQSKRISDGDPWPPGSRWAPGGEAEHAAQRKRWVIGFAVQRDAEGRDPDAEDAAYLEAVAAHPEIRKQD